MKKVLSAVAIAAASLSATAAHAELSCGENGRVMIYDIAAVKEVVKSGHNVMVFSVDGNHFGSWHLEPQEVSCNGDESSNFILRAKDGTTIDQLPGVEAIGELVRIILMK